MSWSDDWEGIGHVNCLSRKDFVVPWLKFWSSARDGGPPQHIYPYITCWVGWGEEIIIIRNALYQGMLVNVKKTSEQNGNPMESHDELKPDTVLGWQFFFFSLRCVFWLFVWWDGWLSFSFDLKPNKQVIFFPAEVRNLGQGCRFVPLYIFGNKVTDGTYGSKYGFHGLAALIQGKIYKPVGRSFSL